MKPIIVIRIEVGFSKATEKVGIQAMSLDIIISPHTTSSCFMKMPETVTNPSNHIYSPPWDVNVTFLIGLYTVVIPYTGINVPI